MNKRKQEKVIRKTETGREVVRLQFEIDPSLWESLEIYQQKGALATKRELLNNAFTLLKWAANHKEQGHSITANSQSGMIYELELPFLDNIEFSSQKRLKLVS